MLSFVSHICRILSAILETILQFRFLCQHHRRSFVLQVVSSDKIISGGRWVHDPGFKVDDETFSIEIFK